MQEERRIPVELVYETDVPEVAATFTRLPRIGNLHRTIANSPHIFPHYVALGQSLRFQTLIEPTERELAILCVLLRHGGDYEYVLHREYAISLGLSEAEVDHTTRPDETSVYSERQRALLRFAERFAADPAIRPTLPEDRITDYLDNRTLIELSLTLAMYIGAAHLTAVLDVPHET